MDKLVRTTAQGTLHHPPSHPGQDMLSMTATPACLYTTRPVLLLGTILQQVAILLMMLLRSMIWSLRSALVATECGRSPRSRGTWHLEPACLMGHWWGQGIITQTTIIRTITILNRNTTFR